MSRKDKYGRGSAAANGEGFVDLVPGDTFAALEAQLKRRIADRFDNAVLGISAMIGSKRNASELAKHLASGEEEEVHKFAAKNIGMLFARGQLGISHDDKKAIVGQRWITRFIRVFTPFRFAGEGYLATLTLKDVDPDKRIYAVEAVEINQDAKSRSTPRGAISEDLNSAPVQDLTSQLASMVSYYVGDVNRTYPIFVGRAESFTVNRTVELLENFLTSAISHQPLTTNHQSPTFSIIIPVYNVAPYLRECLDSVLAQTFTDWEAICVDDGSTDGSGEILDEYREKVEKLGGGGRRTGTIVVIHQKNAGVSAARNAALDVAKGEYIGFLDGDDVWLPQFLQCVYAETVAHEEVDWLRLSFVRWKGDARPHLDSVGTAEYVREDVAFVLWNEICRKGYGCMNFYRRTCIGGHRFNAHLRISEDTLFSLGLSERLNSVCFIQYAGYLYRMREDSALRGTHWRKAGDALGFLREFAKLVEQMSFRHVDFIDKCGDAIDARMSLFVRRWWRSIKEVTDEDCKELRRQVFRLSGLGVHFCRDASPTMKVYWWFSLVLAKACVINAIRTGCVRRSIDFGKMCFCKVLNLSDEH